MVCCETLKRNMKTKVKVAASWKRRTEFLARLVLRVQVKSFLANPNQVASHFVCDQLKSQVGLYMQLFLKCTRGTIIY
jgi:hypothetical protein